MKKVLFIVIVSILNSGCSSLSGEVSFHSANSKAGFQHPYFLFIPEGITDKEVHLIVQPNNTGFVSDDFDDHIESAENLATNRGNIGKYLSHELKYPLLIPVFPRAESTWKIYTHALDRDAMLQKGNLLERIDLQLLAMVRDAKTRLQESGVTVKDKILITGFSASGTFVNRFTAIHPDKVQTCAAGGLNSILFLPEEKLGDYELNYPLGINDFKEITGKSFDSMAFAKTPQFLFMGELDDNDAASYGDAYDDTERNIIYDLLGKEMQPTRWNTCANVYKKRNIDGHIKTYKEMGHGFSEEIRQDILSFFKENTTE